MNFKVGFEDEMKQIIRLLPSLSLPLLRINIIIEKRQTLLFSATQTRKVEDLARISLKKVPLAFSSRKADIFHLGAALCWHS